MCEKNKKENVKHKLKTVYFCKPIYYIEYLQIQYVYYKAIKYKLQTNTNECLGEISDKFKTKLQHKQDDGQTYMLHICL